MMRWLVLALLLIATPAQAAVLWFTGAESASINSSGGGLDGPWSTVTLVSADTTPAPPHTGGYALQSGDTTSQAQTIGGFGLTTMFTRFWFQWRTLAANQCIAQFINAADTKGLLLVLRQSDSKLFFGHNNLTLIAAGTTALTVNTWYLIEVKVVVSATVGGMELKVNGNTEFTSLGTDTSDTIAYDRIVFGPQNCGGTHTTVYGYDDLMICSTSYCPSSGGTIARQGTAGTPTYNAWTKVSCAGGTIDGCWSNTPFSTTSSATSSVASDAQTMFVSSFGSTQTGHGTETIGNTSTINACKTVMIAKSGTASAPLSIRRRISGVDTDTAITLTTSDAVYEDGIWTTTAGVLRNSANMEIGALHGTGVATDTVEDIGLHCDFVNASQAPKHRVIQQ